MQALRIRNLLPAILCLSCVEACTDRGDAIDTGAALGSARAELLAELEKKGEVDVIVHFREPLLHFEYGERDTRRRRLKATRESLLTSRPSGFVVTRTYEHVAAVAGRVDRVALDVLLGDPLVSEVRLDGRGSGALRVAVPAIAADRAQADHGVTGRGIVVGVLDTGVNAVHPDLSTSVSSTQHCFTQNSCPPSGSREGTSAVDDHGHGSHVSGIITSDGSVAGIGFAPNAEIVPVKINDENSAGLVSDWVAGLDWLYENLSTLNVTLINMSIGTDRLYGSVEECDAGERALAEAVGQLVDAGVTLFASSGNRGSSSQMSAPACNSGVIAVGATYKSAQGRQPTNGTYADRWGSSFGDCADASSEFDQVTCFTNSGVRLDIVAPGAVIASDVLGTATEEYRGTSQASPAAAGIAALMLECNPALTPAEIRRILVETGVSVTDSKNGRSYPSLRADRALDAACSTGTGGEGGAAGSAGSGGLGGRNPTAGAGGSADSGGAGGGAGMDPGGAGGNAGASAGMAGGGAAGRAGAGAAPTGGGAGLGGASGLAGSPSGGGPAGTGNGGGTARSDQSAPADTASCACRAGSSRAGFSLWALAAALVAAARVRQRGRARVKRKRGGYGLQSVTPVSE
jgi:serine protease AprX